MEKRKFSIIQKLTISYECTLAIGNSLNLSEMLHEVIHKIIHKTNAHRGSIWINIEKNERNLKLGASAGIRLSEEEIGKRTVFFKEVFKKIWAKQRLVIKYKDEKDFLKYCHIITGKEQSVLIVPINDVAMFHIVYANKEIVDETLGNILIDLSQKLITAIKACLAYENIKREIKIRQEKELALKISEERFQNIVANTGDWIWEIDEKGRYTYSNTVLKQVLGYKQKEVLGKYFYEFFTPDKRDEFKKVVFRSFKMKEKLKNFINQNVHKNGNTIILETNAVPLHDEKGNLLGYRGVSRDVTERKRTEQTQSVLHNIANAVNTAKDLNELFELIQKYLGRIVDTKNFYVALYDRETDMISLPYEVDEKDKFTSFPAGKTLTAYVIRSGKPLLADEELCERLTRAGVIETIGTPSKIWLGIPLKIGKEVIGVVVVQSYIDASLYSKKELEILEFASDHIAIAIARKRAEEELQIEKAYLEQLFESAPEAVVLVDNNSRILRMNNEFTKMFGYTPAEALGQSIDKLIASQDFIDEAASLTKQVADGRRVGLETIRCHKNGTLIDVSLLGAPIKVEGRQVAVYAIYRDITTRKQAEEALAEEKERLSVTLRSIGDGVITTDIEGKIVLINKVAEKLTGWRQVEAIGKPLSEVFHIINEKSRKRCKNPFEKVVKSGEITGLANNTILIARNGIERIIADSGAPIRDKDSKIIGIVLVFRDITEKRKMEEELLKASKIESVGILAGGIAHDFNNILTAMIGNISLAKEYSRPEDEIFKVLIKMEKASMQAKDLTQQLLTFAKGGIPIKKTIFIVDLIKDSTVFALRGSNVRCEFFIPDDLWPVEIDEGQISQVINNLIINADQAMPGGGVINVSAENIIIDTKKALPLKKGKYIELSIEDHGIGIANEHLQKIFDPYYTTKQKGSGLGLAITYSIIKSHNGQITVESEVGTGTIFYIYLPASLEKAPKSEWQSEVKLVFGKGRVLVMDDEEVVRDVAGKMLEYLGYEVEFAKDGREAINLYREAKRSRIPFDVVILDLTVPGGMGGEESIKKLIEIDPEIKAIVSSGYSNDLIMANFKEYGFAGVVSKPYKIQELSVVFNKVTKGKKQ